MLVMLFKDTVILVLSKYVSLTPQIMEAKPAI